MRSTLLLIPALALSLAACTPEEQTTVGAAAAGALIGAAVSSDKDRAKGAILGAGVGVVGAAVVNESNNSRQMCRYRDSYGQIYEAPC
jgi:hypothetical protein